MCSYFWLSGSNPTTELMGVAQKKAGGVTQVLVLGSTYQGSILVPVF